MSIHTLHDDVIIIIFEISADINPANPFKDGHLGWVTLSHVNRRWRLLLLDQPVLWGRVVCKFPSRDAYRTCLDRTQTAPLDLNVDRDWVQKCTTVEELASLVPRARKIWATDIWTSISTLPLAGLTLPWLEELAIVDSHTTDKTLFAPSLRRLTICAIPFLISASHLRTLCINVSPYNSEDAHLLPGIVTAFSKLEELTISFAKPEPQQWPVAPRNDRDPLNEILNGLQRGMPPKNMPNLISFRIEHCDELFMTVMWRSLVIPRTATVNVVYCAGMVQRPAMTEPLRTYMSDPEYDTLSIVTSSNDREHVCSPRTREDRVIGSCNVTFRGFGLMNLLRGFGRCFSESTRTRKLHLVNNLINRMRQRFLIVPTPSIPLESSHIQSLELSGPAAIDSTNVFFFVNLSQLRTLAIDYTTQRHYDRHVMPDLARMLRIRATYMPGATKLERIVIRGWVPQAEKSTLERDLLDWGFHEFADVVLDERVVRPDRTD